jgi:hypothetical protein
VCGRETVVSIQVIDEMKGRCVPAYSILLLPLGSPAMLSPLPRPALFHGVPYELNGSGCHPADFQFVF